MCADQNRPFDPECIFCRIVKGDIPSYRVYEDADMFGFLDLGPVAKGHLLLVPKGHYASVLDVPEELGTAVLRAISRTGNAVLKTLHADGFNLMQNTHEAAGQTVFHAHWHIIPRFHGDGLRHWPQKQDTDKDCMRAVAEALRSATA